ncbi:MAG: tetratricopeptide repeat protein, partial [Bacteroidaceae bacterium]|nr:tetratricopeptide repeat protein [Bacteroidaceae bacterium]
MRISRLYIGILLLCGVGCGFISCGSQKQAVQKKHSVAKAKSKNAVKIPQLSYEQQRQFDYCFSEALRMRRLGEHSAAFEMYKHCLEIQPMDGRTLFDLASYYMSLNLKDKAEEYYKKAVECDPDNFWYKQILANLYEYD